MELKCAAALGTEFAMLQLRQDSVVGHVVQKDRTAPAELRLGSVSARARILRTPTQVPPPPAPANAS